MTAFALDKTLDYSDPWRPFGRVPYENRVLWENPHVSVSRSTTGRKRVGFAAIRDR